MKIKKKREFIAMIIFLLALASAAAIYIDNNTLEVTKYSVSSNKIPPSFNGFKILQLSDLHSKSFGTDSFRLMDRINSQNPDIIVMTGDMVNTLDRNFDVFINLAQQVSKKYKVYYIVGNHEQNLKYYKLNSLEDKLKSFGIRVLDNEKVTLTMGSGSINLYGLRQNIRYYTDVLNGYSKYVYYEEGQIETALGKLDNSSYNILLTHNPLYFDTYSSWGADLTLSGHIHGGMVRIPFAGGLFSPERKIFPKFDAGEYEIDGKELIVNRGLGNGYFGVRIFNPPEISVITLKD